MDTASNETGEATVADVNEPTNVSDSGTFPATRGHESVNPFENLGPAPFSGGSSNASDPLSGFASMLNPSDQNNSHCTELENADMDKLAKYFAETSDPQQLAEVMKEFRKVHPNMKPEVFMSHFPAKMNPLIENLPPEEKFAKMMTMLNTFAAVDPMIGKAMECLGPMMSGSTEPPSNQTMAELMKELSSCLDDEVRAEMPDFLMTDGPFNEGLDNLSLEELNQLDEFSQSTFGNFMNQVTGNQQEAPRRRSRRAKK